MDIIVLGAFVAFLTFILNGYHKSKYEQRLKDKEL